MGSIVSDYTPLRRSDGGPIPSPFTVKIKETNIGGHIAFRAVGEDCPMCGEEMMNIMCVGEVCIRCDSKSEEKTSVNENKTVEL